MPTDEQRMRERFESDCLHISEEQLARTKAGDYATEWVHGTWIGYAIAYKARDAEVQALREEVVYYKDRLRRVLDNSPARIQEVRSLDAEVQALRKGLTLISRLYDSPESDDAVLLREAVDIATCATEDADAALAGEEATDE